MMKKGDLIYNKFAAENIQDEELDRELDKLIDEQLALGKSDQDILEYVA